jgi:hypothetical protein
VFISCSFMGLGAVLASRSRLRSTRPEAHGSVYLLTHRSRISRIGTLIEVGAAFRDHFAGW